MRTNLKEKTGNKQTLNNISVEIGSEEKAGLNTFFAFPGMKTAFLDDNQNKGYTLRMLNYALDHGSFKMRLLKDVRLFVENHKGEVEEFIKDIPQAS